MRSLHDPVRQSPRNGRGARRRTPTARASGQAAAGAGCRRWSGYRDGRPAGVQRQGDVGRIGGEVGGDEELDVGSAAEEGPDRGLFGDEELEVAVGDRGILVAQRDQAAVVLGDHAGVALARRRRQP